MAILRTPSAALLLVTLALAGSPARAEIKGDAIRIGVLTDMNGIFATAMGPDDVGTPLQNF